MANNLHSQGRGGPSSIPGQEARSHMPQPRVHKLQPEILSAAMEISSATVNTQCGQIHKQIFIKVIVTRCSVTTKRARMGGMLRREGIHTYIWLIHFVEQQKPMQNCKAIILQ